MQSHYIFCIVGGIIFKPLEPSNYQNNLLFSYPLFIYIDVMIWNHYKQSILPQSVSEFNRYRSTYVRLYLRTDCTLIHFVCTKLVYIHVQYVHFFTSRSAKNVGSGEEWGVLSSYFITVSLLHFCAFHLRYFSYTPNIKVKIKSNNYNLNARKLPKHSIQHSVRFTCIKTQK